MWVFIAPYYVEVNHDLVQFDPHTHFFPHLIDGTGKRIGGIFESDVTLGLNGKVSAIFEFGSHGGSSILGIEGGLNLEIFPRRVVIVPLQDNRIFFPSLFLSLMFGKKK